MRLACSEQVKDDSLAFWTITHLQATPQPARSALAMQLFTDVAFAAAATSGNTYGVGTTPADQSAYYKLVYSYTESSIDSGDVLKGVAFWRWDAIDTGSTLSALDSALSLSAPPFRQFLLCMHVHWKPLGSRRIGCPCAQHIHLSSYVINPA